MSSRDGVGNKKRFVDISTTTISTEDDLKNSNFDITTEIGTDNFINGISTFVDSSDVFRSRTGYSYTLSGNDYSKLISNNAASMPLEIKISDIGTTNQSIGFIEVNNQQNNNLSNLGNNLTKIKVELLNDLVGTSFSDHYHEITTPAVESDSDEDNNVPKKMFLKCKTSYNYYHDKYEKFLNTTDANENILPNLYNFISENIADKPVEDVRFQNTLGGRIDISKNPLVKTPKAKKFSSINNVPLEEYLRNYALIYDQLPQETITKIIEKSKNVVIPLVATKDFQSQNSKKDFFPAYIELEFAKSAKSEFVEILRTSKKEDDFVSNLINLIESDQYTGVPFSTKSSNLDGTKEQSSVESKVWDVPTQLMIKNSNVEETISRTTTYLGDENITNNLDTSPRFSIFNSIVDVAFETKYENFISDKVRKVQDFLFNKEVNPCYSEVVLYRIAKFANTESDIPTKNYFLLNTSDNEVANFYDTQVKINKNYVYVIYAYTLVVGNEYSYDSFSTGTRAGTFTITNNPSVKLIEHVIGRADNYVLSDPPMIPDVIPYTFFDVDNQVGFNFNSSVGSRLMRPVTLSSQEEHRVAKLKKTQNRELNPINKILYSGDSPNRFYEVYRISEPPVSEKSFVGSLRTRTSKTSFVDTIEPNRKYYYLFRAIDNHGNFSNPSSVIQVQIIKDRTIFTEIRNYTYDNERNIKNKSRTFKKYFRVIPSAPNLLLDLVKSGIEKESGESIKGSSETGFLSIKDITNPSLGVGPHTIWGKKFKLRITSRSSGKKLDINFRMKQKYVKPDEELI